MRQPRLMLRRVLRLPSLLLLLLWVVSLLASSNSSGIPTGRKWWYSIATLSRGGKQQSPSAESKSNNDTDTHSQTSSTRSDDTCSLNNSSEVDASDTRFLVAESSLDIDSSQGKRSVTERQTQTRDTSLIRNLTQPQEPETDNEALVRRRRFFLDRIAVISNSWMRRESDAKLHPDAEAATDLSHLDDITPQSDLSLPGRYFHIVTTASIPWATGTAVNPLLRAAYLHRRTQIINNNNSSSNTTDNNSNRWVTLMIPWLELPEDQQELYGKVFQDPADQERYIRGWLRDQADMPDAACPDTGLLIIFYPARYHSGLRSIFAMGDMLRVLKDSSSSSMDVCVLEEPEHVNWFRAPGDGWTKQFNYVVGIVHTNYKEYASSHYSGLWSAPAISLVSAAMVRAYCHKVIKLSDVLQTYAPEKEAVSNVHGVRSEFLKEGLRRAEESSLSVVSSSKSVDQHAEGEITTTASSVTSDGIYYIGKLLWAKGLDIMLDLQDYYKQCTGEYFPIDIYGSGPESAVIMKAFHGRRKSDINGEGKNATDFKKDTPKRKKKRSPRERILGTTFTIFGGSRWPSKENEETWNDRGQAKYADMLSSLESFHEKAREKLARIKKHLDSVDLPQTFAELRRQPIPAAFPGRVDHAELKNHKIFVNPSVSEVLCTTTAESLAMGKFAIIPVHPSNAFFMQFPNCLAYRNKFEFVANLRWAMTHEPEPLSAELARRFSWEAATDRFIEASAITARQALEQERLGLSKLDERIAWFHNELGKGATGDMLRRICGAGPVSEQARYLKDQEKNDGRDVEDGVEDEDDGLSRKFRRSSFAEAIRTTIGDMSIQ